ncbi:MAG: hypothetical protein LDL19_00805 [Thiobacillus sp.]|nr:hypothetical protein [Thiobacillus sp.]
MLWLIPRLFPDPRLLEVAAHGLTLPGLQALLARGTPTAETATGTEAALARALGIGRQQDWPLAPITLEADGGTAGEDYWLRADPVHLHLMRDRIVLAGLPLTDLMQADADQLTRDISRHFGQDFPLEAPHPERWYLRFPLPLQLSTTSPSLAAGCAIDTVMPQGKDAAALRVRLNEIQMLLHDHPVNQAREARGALPVNSLWLWGGGVLPPPPDKPVPPVYARSEIAHAIARHSSAETTVLPAALSPDVLGRPGVLLLDALDMPAAFGDMLGWREALRQLENHWFAPLVKALPKLGRQGVHLLDPVSGRGVMLHRLDALKFWRRPKALASGLGE